MYKMTIHFLTECTSVGKNEVGKIEVGKSSYC